jgi:heme/copper-type cytochrome/quinol oxidase subunit 2
MIQNRFWQGFFALAPILMIIPLIFGYIFFVFNLVQQAEMHNGDMAATSVLSQVGLFMILIFVMILISLGSLIFYIIHAVQNPNLKGNNLLIVWILLFIFVSGIGQLIYWIVEIQAKKHDPPQITQ